MGTLLRLTVFFLFSRVYIMVSIIELKFLYLTKVVLYVNYAQVTRSDTINICDSSKKYDYKALILT